MTMPDAALLQQRLRYTFLDESRLDWALTHKTFTNEPAGKGRPDNGGLACLGDAVLGVAVKAKLIQEDRSLTKEDLTTLSGRTVNNEHLALLAKRLGLGGFLRLGHGEELSGGRENATNLAGAFEAVAGAVHLDAGPAHAFRVVDALLERLERET